MLQGNELVYLSQGGVPVSVQEIADFVSREAGAVTWDSVTGKPATFPPTIGTTATTALAGNTAIPAASTTAPAALATAAAVGTGTTFARADHVHAIPGASVGTTRGTVLIQTAIADLTADPTMADFNGLLAKLRSAGILST